jgi:hypothetical protein
VEGIGFQPEVGCGAGRVEESDFRRLESSGLGLLKK